MSSVTESLWENASYVPLKANLKNKFYKIKHWPNFGFSEYKPEYVRLSALLAYQTFTKAELIEVTAYDEHYINHFLNAAYLLQLLDVQESTKRKPFVFKRKFNLFTFRLKAVFGF